MSEKTLVRHCSPTLAGIKTGSLFTAEAADADALRQTLRRYNRTLGAKGVRLLPLRWHNGRALLYVYRPARLTQDLQADGARQLLRRCGYPTEDATRCVVRLMHRVCEGPEFPHEIGLFLGYPPEDVRGFIERDTPCKCVGCWKVYGDAAAAEERFRQYRRCTAAYCRALALGQSVERLTVADRIEKDQQKGRKKR